MQFLSWRKKLVLRRVFLLLKSVLCILVIMFLSLPFGFHFSPWLQRNLVFLPSVRMPSNFNFSDPSSVGLNLTYNMYLKSAEGVTIGVWHILPAKYAQENSDNKSNTVGLDSGDPVVLYLHGNTAHRGAPARVELYKVLRNMNYHVVTIDYRGFADSSKVNPTATGVTADARAAYDWIVNNIDQATKLIVWGHSLGSGVATHLLAELTDNPNRPNLLVLESPFNNIMDEVRCHHMSRPWRMIPWFDWFFVKPLVENDLVFRNDDNLPSINVPILILHAEDDMVIPIQLSRRLHKKQLTSRNTTNRNIEFISFSGSHGYGHSGIYQAQDLPSILAKYVEKH